MCPFLLLLDALPQYSPMPQYAITVSRLLYLQQDVAHTFGGTGSRTSSGWQLQDVWHYRSSKLPGCVRRTTAHTTHIQQHGGAAAVLRDELFNALANIMMLRFARAATNDEQHHGTWKIQLQSAGKHLLRCCHVLTCVCNSPEKPCDPPVHRHATNQCKAAPMNHLIPHRLQVGPQRGQGEVGLCHSLRAAATP